MDCLIVVLSASLALAPGSPDDARPPASAKKLAAAHYRRGVALFKETNYPAALAEFRAAYQALPNWQVLFNIGLCERRLFKYGPALTSLNRYLTEGGAKVARERRTAVAQELEQIRALTALVSIEVDGPPAALFIDQEPCGETPLSQAVPLGSGRHVVRAEREGHEPDEKTIAVVFGQPQEVRLAPRSLTEPVRVRVETQPPGAMVHVDDTAAPVAGPTTLALPPGTHEVLVKADGFSPLRTDVVVRPGMPRTVTVALVPLSSLTPPAIVPTVVAARPFPVLGVSLLTGGVLAGALGLFFGLEAKALGQKVTALSATGGTWDEHWVTVDARGRRDSALAWTFISVGATAAIAGVILTTLSVVHAPGPPKSTVTVVPLPSGALATWMVFL